MAKAEEKTVLVVDDEPDIVTFLATALEDAGFQVLTASDGEEAMARLAERKPDFISLDLVMPRKGGVKVFHELRRNREWSSIPVMVVTGHARDEQGSRDLQTILGEKTMSGPGLYLEKPVKAPEFVQAVARTLGVDLPPEIAPGGADELREQARRAVDAASPDELAAALAILRRRRPPGG